MKNVLCIQISTNLINKDVKADDLSTRHYNALYRVKEHEGYYRGADFWELPKWIALINYNIPCNLYVCKDIKDTIRHLKRSKYTCICFSVLDMNKDIIKEILNAPALKDKLFIIGGYINFDKYFKELKYNNYGYFKTIKDFINFIPTINGSFKYGYNYDIFKGFKTIPRLTLSEGCLNKCDFCTIEKKIKEISYKDILKEIKNIGYLDFKLVYINDKTLGQCPNYRLLPTLYEKIKAYRADFEGFIIQTTTSTLLHKFTSDFIAKSHIKYIELGIETFNPYVLRKYHKPSNNDLAKTTFKLIREYNKLHIKPVYIIPNIMIGFPEETIKSYAHTLEELFNYRDVISHLNIYNLAIYDNTDISKKIKHTKNDNNELEVNKSFHKDNRHIDFYNEIFNLGLHLIKRRVLN